LSCAVSDFWYKLFLLIGPVSVTGSAGLKTGVASVRGVPRFAAFDTSSLRNASGAGRLPWLGRSVTLLRVDSTGVVRQAKTDSEKRALLESATSKDLVLVAWPGQWSQDIYVVDDLRAARAAVRG
jgi:hypothetical protein